MIDMSIVKSNGATYSVKSSLFTRSDGAVMLKVIYIYEVKMIDATSFQKLKALFDSSTDDEEFNISRFKDIFDKLVVSLQRKYKITCLVI